MEPEGSLPQSQVPATCPYPEPDQPIPFTTFHFLKIHLNIFLPSTPGLFPSGFPTKIVYATGLSLIHATFPVHLILLDLITRIIFGEVYRSLSPSLFSYLHSNLTSYFLGVNSLLSALFWYTLSLRFSLSVSDQDSHPYKTTGKLIVLCILLFIFLYSLLENRRFRTDW